MSVQFDVERFEWADDDRLELEGRWFGLRGRRFVRPTLDVEVDGEQRRLLALMEHKPWAALDGEVWLAAFAWDGDRSEIEAQLALGSGLTFELPRPGGAGMAAPKQPPKERESAATPERAVDDELERRLAAAESARAEIAGEVQALRRAFAQKERTVRELEQALRTARDAAAAAAGEADDLGPRLEVVVAARDTALTQAQEAQREAIAGTRARDDAHAERDRADADREEARTAARDARAERDAMRRERDTAVAERDAALETLDATRRARDSAQLARDAARAERPQVQAVAEAVRRRGPQALARLHRDRTRDEVLAMRFAALVALSIVCLLIAIWILAA